MPDLELLTELTKYGQLASRRYGVSRPDEWEHDARVAHALRARVAELEAIVDRCAHDEWNRGFYGPARQFLKTI